MRLAAASCVLVLAACAASPPATAPRVDDDSHAEGLPVARLVCPAGRGDCDTDPGNGCEADLSSDADNCRACGHMCSTLGAGAMCMDGRCALPAAPRGR